MGPDKTGSTSLQDFLQNHRSLLQQDGYDVTFSKNTLGKKGRDKKQLFNVLLTCLSQDKFMKQPCHRHNNNNNNNMQGKLQSLVRHLTSQVEQRPNVFLSNEGFRWARLATHPDWAWFVEQLVLQHHYELHVVLVYRRYYDWLSSRYQEDNRHSEWTGMAFLLWPEEGGRTVHSLLEYIELDLQLQCATAHKTKKKKRDVTCEMHFANRIQVMADGSQQVLGHPLIEMAKSLLWKHNTSTSSTISVQVINFHAPRDLVEAIICDTLPPTVVGRNTTHTCEKLQKDNAAKQQQVLDMSNKEQRQRQTSSSRQTNVLSIQYDRIGLEAHRLGILDKRVARNSAKAVIAKYYQKKAKEEEDELLLLPWMCPSRDILDRLEGLSYQFEQDLLAMDRTTSIGRSIMVNNITFPESHARAFAKALANKRFCEVNVTKVLLEDEAFREYLASQK